MGGKSSSSASTSTTTVQTDERIAATDSAEVRIFKVDGNSNTLTDHEAISQAGALALEALSTTANIALRALDNNKASSDRLGENSDKVLSFVDDQNRDEGSRTVTELAPWLLVGVSVVALMRAWKG